MPYVWKRPHGDLLDMYEKINRLFEDDFPGHDPKNRLSPGYWSPATDIFETKENYVFKIELPGISKDDITVELSGENLIVNGERKEEQEVKKEEFHRIERFYGTFSRCFTLPKNANGEKMTASMKDGILELRIPKQKKAKTKAIPIDIK